MKVKTTSTFTLEENELAAIGTVIDILNDMMNEADEYGEAAMRVDDYGYPLSIPANATLFLDSLWSTGCAEISAANYDEDDEQLSFDDFEEGDEDYEGKDEV